MKPFKCQACPVIDKNLAKDRRIAELERNNDILAGYIRELQAQIDAEKLAIDGEQ